MGTIADPGAESARRGRTRSGASRTASSGGLVVALIGPDGVGKSCQTARLTSIFQKEYRCSAVYLGSGDGGWEFRRIAKRYFRKWRDRRLPPNAEVRAPEPGKEYGTSHSLPTALSGLMTAVERYFTLRRAMRLAESGSIVISDRWPQNLQPGFFDGPLRLHPRASPMVRLLSRVERSFYRRMEAYRPDLTIHLLIDFETSNARKPGDRTPADFDQRLSLMEQMRSLDPDIKTVDARNELDKVTKDLAACIRHALAEGSRE